MLIGVPSRGVKRATQSHFPHLYASARHLGSFDVLLCPVVFWSCLCPLFPPLPFDRLLPPSVNEFSRHCDQYWNQYKTEDRNCILFLTWCLCCCVKACRFSVETGHGCELWPLQIPQVPVCGSEAQSSRSFWPSKHQDHRNDNPTVSGL